MKKIILIITIIIFMFVCFLTLYPHKKYTDKDFNIKTLTSKIDKDKDGIDDYSDIIQSVRSYIKTKPKYKSKYYATGYPNDQYGVCTDVVAFGLKGAGYDLLELVYQDVINNREAYSIDKVDKNIDFRRVRNLKVYFKRNAISLTTNIYKIAKWQRGDIIIFEKHIGIISDKRNKKGIPYVIHNAGGLQMSYEEDILESRNDIVGHYRIS